MTSVRIRYSRLCDVPIGLMSEKDAAKFDYLMFRWLPHTIWSPRKLATYLDLFEFRKYLTPCELEILDLRYGGRSTEEVSAMLGMPPENLQEALQVIGRKAERFGLTDLQISLFEREWAGALENRHRDRKQLHEKREQMKRIAAERRLDEEYAGEAVLNGPEASVRRCR